MFTVFEKHASCINTSIPLLFLWPKQPIYLETCLYECLLAHYTAESVKDSQTKCTRKGYVYTNVSRVALIF